MICRVSAVFGLAVSGLWPFAGRAQVAFSDYGPGYSYGNGVAWAVTGSGWAFSNNEDYEIAEQFTSAASGSLSQLILSGYANTDQAIATMSLRQDSGNVVGSVMGSWTVTLPPRPGPGQAVGPVFITNTDSSVSLVAGGTYWLEMSAPIGSNSSFGWYQNGVGFDDLYAYQINNGAWTTYQSQIAATFEVDVSPAPEPASVLLLCAGSASLIRRNRRASRLGRQASV